MENANIGARLIALKHMKVILRLSVSFDNSHERDASGQEALNTFILSV